MGEENWISQCIPAESSVLSVPGLLGGMTDTTSDEFIHHLFALVILCLHRLDVGDGRSQNFHFAWNLESKACLRIPVGS